MKQVFIISTVLVVFWACGASSEKVPKDKILTHAQMAKVMEDIYLLEAKVKSLGLPTDTSKALFSSLQDRVFKDNNTTDSIFYQSLAYYWENGSEGLEVYGMLLDSIGLKEQILRKDTE